MTGAAELFRVVGLRPDGPAILGRPIRAAGAGVYVVELPAPLPTPPIDPVRIGKWLERLPDLRLDGERPTPKALAARLAAFWLPRQTVLYIGASDRSIGGRVTALDHHVLGDRQPHAASQWLKVLSIADLRVWWAETSAHEEYEDALFEAFGDGVDPTDRAALPDALVLPFANLRAPSGATKPHGLRHAVAAAPVVPTMPPTRVVTVPPGDAEGAGERARRTGPGRPARAASKPRAAATPRQPRAATHPGGPKAEPVLVTEAGLAALRSEHASLVARRPEVVGRIRSAKELGDLKENADYAAAREEQSFLEGRIQAIEAQLRVAVVADAPAGDRVAHGSHLTVESEDGTRRLQLVGSAESNPSAGRISAASPVGRALLGRSVGDEVTVPTPGGEVRYRVVSID